MRALILAALLLAPLPAAAQGWKLYSYSDNGFALQLPAEPTVTKGAFKTSTGISVPSVTYALAQPDIAYSMIVADFSQTTMDKDTALKEAVKAYGALGQVKLDVEERINQEYGHQLTLVGKDGSRSNVSVFFVNHRLYEQEGKALPPEPAAGAGKAVRFQQSLEFIGLGGGEGFRRGGRGPGGFAGGPGGRGERRAPSPAALEDCLGKAVGDAVQLALPRGVVDATCVQTPGGLAARPNRPPPGGPGRGPPREG
jgi:hypothetical protein